MKRVWVFASCLGLFLSPLRGFATQGEAFGVRHSLPQTALAYYNDPFDKLRSGLWEKAPGTFNRAQTVDFKLADMRIEHGELVITTEPGHFSKAGLVSKYTIKGDFDIQVDCRIEFVETMLDMDQVVFFGVFRKRTQEEESNPVSIGPSRRAGRNSVIISRSWANGRPVFKAQPMGNFSGTLRIVRVGARIRTLYTTRGEPEWKEMLSFPGMTDPVAVGLGLQNFTGPRTSILAPVSVTARFDNFRVNAAQEIIEETI